MIIVEGPDGAGKTTLISELVEETGLQVAPRVVSKDTEAMTDLVKWTEENTRAGFQATIFDRHRLISEPIYGPILREQLTPEFTDPEWFYHQLSALYHCNPFIIYCLPPFQTVMENILSTEDNKFFHGNPYAVQAIWGAYLNKAMTESVHRDRTFIYNYEDSIDVQQVLPFVTARIKEQLLHV